MDSNKLKIEAKKIVSDLFFANDDGGLCADDYIDLYESIIELAEKHASAVQYEAEAKIDELTGKTE